MYICAVFCAWLTTDHVAPLALTQSASAKCTVCWPQQAASCCQSVAPQTIRSSRIS